MEQKSTMGTRGACFLATQLLPCAPQHCVALQSALQTSCQASGQITSCATYANICTALVLSFPTLSVGELEWSGCHASPRCLTVLQHTMLHNHPVDATKYFRCGASVGACLDGSCQACCEDICRDVWGLRQQLVGAAGSQQDAITEPILRAAVVRGPCIP